jgi:predicted secreted protein with PEFG-CTERM motif
MYFLVRKIIQLFAISILFCSTALVYAQTESTFAVKTSQAAYDEGETIVVSGNVKAIILDTPVTLQIFHEVNLVEIAQLIVAQDGKFTHTIIPEGPLWKSGGTYTVRVTYGSDNMIETNFEFYTKQSVEETTNIFEVDAGTSGTFDVSYTIRGGTVKDMLVDPDNFALIVIVDSEIDGSITLDLPRASIDAKKNDGTDDTFLVFIDGAEVPIEETVNPNSRKIKIEFEEGDSDIEIIGTFVVPEFGGIVVMIFVIAIISSILISSKKRIFTFPKSF